MNVRGTAITVCVFQLTACASLPQSALIYSSRTTVGLSVTSNPASASGVTMSVGMDMLDAAYVPVAVTTKNKDGSFGGQTGNVQPIAAAFASGDDSQELTDANKAKIDEYVQALNKVATIQSQIKTLTDSKKSTDDLQKQVDQATAQLNALKATGSDTTQTQTALSTAQTALATATAQNKAIEAQVSQIKATDLAQAQQDSDNKRAAAAQAAGLLKKGDALSVYGRFKGNASDSGATAGLVVGKIFSTGVAAQNLTEAARLTASTEARTASTVAYTNCLNAASASKDSSDAQKLAENCLETSGQSTTTSTTSQ